MDILNRPRYLVPYLVSHSRREGIVNNIIRINRNATSHFVHIRFRARLAVNLEGPLDYRGIHLKKNMVPLSAAWLFSAVGNLELPH